MVLPETDVIGALTKAERLRSVIAAYEFDHADTQPIGCVSVSIGVASFPQHGDDRQELIALADKMLYRAKHAGRNKVCVP